MTEHTKTGLTVVIVMVSWTVLLFAVIRIQDPVTSPEKAYIADLKAQSPIPESIRATVANELADCLGALIREPGMTFGMAVQVCFARMGLKRIWRVPGEGK